MARIATITKKEDLAPEHQKVYRHHRAEPRRRRRAVAGVVAQPGAGGAHGASGELYPFRIQFRSQSHRVYGVGVGAGAGHASMNGRRILCTERKPAFRWKPFAPFIRKKARRVFLPKRQRS